VGMDVPASAVVELIVGVNLMALAAEEVVM
jgi:hypothetical protein